MTRPRLDIALLPPRSPVEETVAAIWCGVLLLDEVGIHDPFLELGGNSLAASRIVSKVAASFGVEQNLASLFSADTVAAMAVVVLDQVVAATDSGQLAHLLDALETTENRSLFQHEAGGAGSETASSPPGDWTRA